MKRRTDQMLFEWATPPRPSPPPPPARRVAPMLSPNARPFTFYLGVHKPHWLFDPAMQGVPLFISYRQMRELQDVRSLRPAQTKWCLDSGGFKELSTEGRWTYDARRYADGVRRFMQECGGLEWAAIMDWMTEECVLSLTGLDVERHQQLTIDSLIELRTIAPDVPWAPVLQGWGIGDHERHLEMYYARGIDLRREPVVGVGSICRRSATLRAAMMLADLAEHGLRLHALGFKTDGLTNVTLSNRPLGTSLRGTPWERYGAWLPVWKLLRSADSTAWSFDARYSAPLPGCTHQHCNNCQLYARRWYENLLAKLEHVDPDALNNGAGPYPWPEVVIEGR